MRKAQALRWAWAGLAFGLSPLYFLHAPRIPLFKLQLGLTEFGHWLALPSLLLLLWPTGPWARNKARLACALAALLYLSPALRAWALAPQVAREAAAAWPDAPADLSPAFSWKRLFQKDAPGAVLAEDTVLFDAEHQLSLTSWHLMSHAERPRPLVVVIHGGGWDGGTRDDFPTWDAAIAQAGYAVLDMDYRLAPASPWPAQRQDIQRVLALAKAHANAWNLDPTRVVLMGRSAGAHLALATGYLDTTGNIKGVASFYGPADLFFAYQYGKPDDILKSLDLLKNFCGGTPDSAKAAYDDASPYFHVGGKTPPTLLAHGRIDALVWNKQSARLTLKLEEAKVPHQFVDLPWATHAFDYNFQGPSGQLAWHSLQRFLKTTLK